MNAKQDEAQSICYSLLGQMLPKQKFTPKKNVIKINDQLFCSFLKWKNNQGFDLELFCTTMAYSCSAVLQKEYYF